MRILHVGFGYRPWIVNGLVIYSETVMEGQVAQGHDVGYFFPARQLPLLRRTILHAWRRRGVRMFELVNSSLVVGRHRGTPDPERDLHHAPSEAAFERVLDRFGPEVIHIHDLGGLPSSILDAAAQRGVPTVMTIHDYQPLCPTVKLYDAHGRICLRSDPGAMCTVCCADAPTDNGEELARTLALARRRIRSTVPGLDALLRRPQTERLGVAGIRLMERAAGTRQAGAPAPHASSAAYQRRRDVNVERLNRLDALIASSRRSAEIYEELGVAGPPVRFIPITPPHIARLHPKRRLNPADPLRFVALNACSSIQKGAHLIVQALAHLTQRGLDGRYRLSVHGAVADEIQDALYAHPSVDVEGDYQAHDLDELLESGDVGLLPSVWEEVYGFAGLEFLAKGIPVIGNAIGAIPDYVLPGQTGWLNRSCSAQELADLMARAIADPNEVGRLSETAIARRDDLIHPLPIGLAELATVYDELVSRTRHTTADALG
ncbi:MAG: glycosyltransferase [Solirubrobacteraceae bacterium]